jgi:hypothetical protein
MKAGAVGREPTPVRAAIRAARPPLRVRTAGSSSVVIRRNVLLARKAENEIL